MSNHGHRGVLSFRIQISPPLCSEKPVPRPPPSELSSHALCVSSRSSPFAVSHHQHHRHHHHHHSTWKSDFRHPFSKYPTVRWKWQVRASIGTAKRDIGVCANTDRVFFSRHDACVWQCIPPNGYLNGLSDEQPWTSWGALFSDPDISALLWMSSSMPPPKWTLVTCLVRLFTQQPLRSVSSSASSSSSSSSSSSFDLKIGFFDIHFPSTQRCDESDRFEHP